MMSCDGKVKLLARSFQVPFPPAGQPLGVGSVAASCFCAYASQVGVESITPLRASMNRTFQPTNGSMRAAPPMLKALEARTAMAQTVRLTWLVPSSCEADPRTAKEGRTQS